MSTDAFADLSILVQVLSTGRIRVLVNRHSVDEEGVSADQVQLTLGPRLARGLASSLEWAADTIEEPQDD